MLNTYRATLHGGRLEWQDEAPADQTAHVHVTILDEAAADARTGRGECMAAALARIATVADPKSWEREIRADRELPGRDE